MARKVVARKVVAAKLAGLALLGVALWLFWPTSPRAPLGTQRLRLSPQECITECQTRQTDCILDCDGHVSCEQVCVRRGEACVARCLRPADAGAAPPASPPARP